MLTKIRSSAMALAAAVMLAGCLDDPAVPVDPPDFHPSLEINLDEMTLLEGGVYILDTTVGGGAVALDTSTVVVHYRGWLKNGSMFDTTRPAGLEPIPLEVKLDYEFLIKGWQVGIPGMKEGGVRKMVVPPEMAYGKQGRAPFIHPNATLVFEVELLEVKAAADSAQAQ